MEEPKTYLPRGFSSPWPHVRRHDEEEIAELCRVAQNKIPKWTHTELPKILGRLVKVFCNPSQIGTFSATFHAIVLGSSVHLSNNKKTSQPEAKILFVWGVGICIHKGDERYSCHLNGRRDGLGKERRRELGVERNYGIHDLDTFRGQGHCSVPFPDFTTSLKYINLKHKK